MEIRFKLNHSFHHNYYDLCSDRPSRYFPFSVRFLLNAGLISNKRTNGTQGEIENTPAAPLFRRNVFLSYIFVSFRWALDKIVRQCTGMESVSENRWRFNGCPEFDSQRSQHVSVSRYFIASFCDTITFIPVLAQKHRCVSST